MIVYITKARHKSLSSGWEPRQPYPGMMAVDMSHWLPRGDHNLNFTEYCEKYEVKELTEKTNEPKKIQKPKKIPKKRKKSVTINAVEPTGEKSVMIILEFDWHYGHEREECETISQAKQRKEQWQITFSSFEFSNWKMYKETRYKEELASKKTKSE